MRPIHLFLALVPLAALAASLASAPVPPPTPRKAVPVRADGPVTADDLRAVRWLAWSGFRWPIVLETATSNGYICISFDSSNRTIWQGDCALVGDEVILEESVYVLHPDAPAEFRGGPDEQRLKVRWQGGKLVGTGWDGPIELTR